MNRLDMELIFQWKEMGNKRKRKKYPVVANATQGIKIEHCRGENLEGFFDLGGEQRPLLSEVIVKQKVKQASE